MTSQSNNPPGNAQAPMPPEGYKLVHQGLALPCYYAAEMLRPYVGRTVWVADSGGRVRCGELAEVPWLKEDQKDDSAPPVRFADEKPLYLRQIVCIAVYQPGR